jgi:tetratricopeptide (TPR) repeat protein
MPTFEGMRQGPNLKKTRDELDLFTDRYSAIRLFASAINDPNSNENSREEKIIFFHGDGGNGKTLLLRFLRQRCCKKLLKDNWQYVKQMEGDEFISNLIHAEAVKEVPSALIDFHNRPAAFGEGISQEAPTALRRLRQDLMVYGFRFPLFDFACVWYLHKALNLPGNMIKSLLPTQELMSNFIDALTGTSYASLVNAALGLFGPKLDVTFTIFTRKRRIAKEQLLEIERLDPRTQLIDSLPEIFARDLNAAMEDKGSPENVALFFDTHEAFWQAGERENDPYFYRDEWLRVLFKTLDRSLGIIIVVSGREPPRWPKANKVAIPQQDLTLSMVGHLSREDAVVLLERSDVNDRELQETLIEYSSVTEGEVHPLMLNMCIEVVRASTGGPTSLDPTNLKTQPQMTKRISELLETLLKYVDVHVDYAIRALSACRAFTLDIYLMLGRELGFNATTPNFGVLKSFSFVWEAKQEGWLHIHSLVRRFLRERTDEVTRRADEVMERYYRQRAEADEDLANVEAIYHANRLEWERGVDEWIEAFNATLKRGRYSFCAALLDLRKDFVVQSVVKRGLMSLCEGKYLAELSRHEEAIYKYKEATPCFDQVLRLNPTDMEASYNKGLTLSGIGYSQYWLSQYEDAIESYKKAVTICSHLVQRTPDNVLVRNHEAETLEKLGRLQSELTKYDEAEHSYQKAVSICDGALILAPSDVTAYYNKGLALLGLGDLYYWKSRYHAALDSCTQAIAVYDEALALAPDDLSVKIRKGWAYAHSGEVWGELSNFVEAVDRYRKAIAISDEVIQRAPDFIAAHNLKGHAYLGVGEMQADKSQCQQGIESYGAALAAYDDVLKHGSSSLDALNGRGYALTGIGELHAKLANYVEAVESYEMAIKAYGRAQQFAPNDVVVANNKAYCLTALGDCSAQLAEHNNAISNYEQAIAIYNDLLRQAPKDAVALDNKGLALSGLGYSQYCLGRYDDAREKYLQAINAHEQALHHASDYASAHNNKSKSLLKLGQLHARLSERKKAAEFYRRAIAASDRALKLAPDCVDTYNLKGLALASLGALQVELSQNNAARRNFIKAIAIYDDALSRAPDDVDAHKNKAAALLNLASLQAVASQPEVTMHSLETALKEVTRCLEMAAQSKDALALRTQIMTALENNSYRLPQ